MGRGILWCLSLPNAIWQMGKGGTRNGLSQGREEGWVHMARTHSVSQNSFCSIKEQAGHDSWLGSLPLPLHLSVFLICVCVFLCLSPFISPYLLSLLGPVFISACISVSFSIFLSLLNSPSASPSLLFSLYLQLPINSLSFPFILLSPSLGVMCGLWSAPLSPPPQRGLLSFLSGLHRARPAPCFPPPRSHSHFRPPGVSKASSSGLLPAGP